MREDRFGFVHLMNAVAQINVTDNGRQICGRKATNFIVSEEEFHFICAKVRPIVEKQNTHLRVAINVEERAALTLKHLPSGDNYNPLSQVFRVSRPSISIIVPEVCSATLNTIMWPEYLQVSIFE